LNTLINIVREPQRNASIFGNSGRDGLLGKNSTRKILNEAGEDSVSDSFFVLLNHLNMKF